MTSVHGVTSLESLHQDYSRSKRVSISAQIQALLHQLILSGKLKTGEHIVERKLARQLRVGAPTVREALRALEDEGLIEYRPNVGCFVTTLSNEECDQIFRMRILLEGLAAEMAVENRGRWDPQQLRAAVQNLRDAARSGDVERFYQYDLQFHQSLWQLSGSSFLVKALTQITVPLFAFTTIKMFQRKLIDLNANAEIHARIAAAVLSGSKRQAKRAIQSATQGFWHKGMKALAQAVNTVIHEEHRVGDFELSSE